MHEGDLALMLSGKKRIISKYHGSDYQRATPRVPALAQRQIRTAEIVDFLNYPATDQKVALLHKIRHCVPFFSAFAK